MKRKQPSLLNCFPNKKISSTEVSDLNEPVDVSQTAIPQLNVICDDNKQNNTTSNLVFDNDIGNFIGKKLDDYTKFRRLENPWKPPKNFEYPFSIHKKKRKRGKTFFKK